MNRGWLVLIPLLLANQAASAATATGGSALALASLVADQSPSVRARDRTVLARLFNGNAGAVFPVGRKIEVRADSVVCRSSNVDITQHGCTLTFGARTVSIQGRRAHELYATIAEIGVPSDGAAGSIYEAVSQLACIVEPQVVEQRGGGGANCTFKPGR